MQCCDTKVFTVFESQFLGDLIADFDGSYVDRLGNSCPVGDISQMTPVGVPDLFSVLVFIGIVPDDGGKGLSAGVQGRRVGRQDLEGRTRLTL